MVTPFDEDGSLNLAEVGKVADHLVRHGHDGIVVNGTTGEGPTTSDAEKRQIIEATREATSREIAIVAGVGTNDTAHTVELAKQAADAGADGLLVVTPYYSRPSQAGLVQHFLRVADATDLPVMVYDIPGRSAQELTLATLEELATHDRIVAVKDATGKPGDSFVKMLATGLAYYGGDDLLGLATLAQGGSGMVSVVGHVVGDQWRQIIDAVDAQDLVTARRVFAQILPVIGAVMGGGQGAVMVKAALEVAGVLPRRTVRLPLFEATEAETGHVREALAATGLRPGN
jgi:4-hydroxy-tetrahydrodipicolinate synthase